MKERANELFEKEQYVEATPLYLQILSLHPKEAEWNFKYGACLLFNSGNKKEAIRYLKYGANTPGTDQRVFYFYGRALHLDYQFDSAKKFYQKYQSQRDKPDKRYPVEREIQMCESGKKLLTTFTDIIVTDKKQIDAGNFYEIYTASQIVGGSIVVNADFQSKLDKKKGHIPTVHIPPNAKRIFYSSYGEDESTGKDIFMRIRLPDGKWGKAQRVPGGVNSPEDEDFPFLHASGNFLYFSSKGHNSMGGYDIFMSRFDPNTNSFGPPENVDFAISSPDDDLFYVVDASFSNAYFASSRSSEQDMLHVYKVKVARVPIQEVIVMGSFTSDIKPEEQKIKLQLRKHTNGDELATMPVSAAKGGTYSYVFPQGGKYDYIVDVDGSDQQYKFTIELPFLSEFRPLKQQIIHTTEDGAEVIRIINRFDESVEGAEAIIAEIIRKKSELNVNVDQFDLEEIEARGKQDEILAELGFENMTLREVSGKLEELESNAIANQEVTERVSANISSELLAKVERVKQLNDMEQELQSSADKAIDPVAKHKLLTEASKKQQEKETLLAQVEGLKEVIGEIMNESAVRSEEIKGVKDTFESLRSDKKDEEALQFLISKKEAVINSQSTSPNKLREKYVNETLKLREDIKKARTRKSEYLQSKESVRARMNTLERQLDGAKRKEQESIEEALETAKNELAVLDQEVERLSNEISSLESDLNTVEERLASYQNALSAEEKSEVANADVEKASKEVKEIAAQTDFNYEEALTALENDFPEINGGEPIEDWATEINKTYQTEVASIQNDAALTPLEQAVRLVESNEKAIEAVDERLTTIQEQLERNPSNEKLRQQETALSNQKEALEKESKTLKAEEKTLKAKTPDVAVSKEDILAELAPDFPEQLQSIEENETLSKREKLERITVVRANFDAQVAQEVKTAEIAIQENPSDEETKAKLTLLQELIEENNAALAAIENQIATIPVESFSEISVSELIDLVDNEYKARTEEIKINDGTQLSKQEALLKENIALLKKLEKELPKVRKELERNPEDTEVAAKEKAIRRAIVNTEALIAENNQNIEALSEESQALATVESVMAESAPNYIQELLAIQEGEGSAIEKAEKIKLLEERTGDDLNRELIKWEKRLERDPDDAQVKGQVTAISAAVTERTEQIAEIDKQIALVSSSQENAAITAQEMLSQLQPDLASSLSEVDQSDDSASGKARRKAVITAGALETLVEESERVSKAVSRSPEDKSLVARKTAFDQAISEQKEVLSQFETDAVALLSKAEQIAILKTVAPDYTNDLEASTAQKIAQEKKLQEDLENVITDKEKALRRKYTVSVSIEKAIFEKLLSESQSREETLDSNAPEVMQESDFVNQLREESGQEVSGALTAESDDLTELKQQEAILGRYEEYLEEKIERQEELIEERSTEENESALNWLVNEKERVSQKRRSVSISIGDLEQVALTSTKEKATVQDIKQQEQRIREARADESLNEKEQRELDRELRNLREARLEIENEQVQTNLSEEKAVSASLQEDLLENKVGNNELAQRTLKYAGAEEKAIANLEEQAENANSAGERNYLLSQAKKRQEDLNEEMNEVVVLSKLSELEETYDITTRSRSDLEKKKRSYTIQLGDLSREIESVTQQVSEAKRKEAPALEVQREALLTQREEVQARLDRVNAQLAEVENIPTALNEKALEEEISYNEERGIAASDAYENYQKVAVEALEVENEIRNLEKELGEKRIELERAVQNRESQEVIVMKARDVQQLEEKLDRKKIDLTQKKYNAEQALPENENDAMKMQNLVARGVQPFKLTAVAAALIQMPTTGFAIDTASERPNNGSIEIPIGVVHPEGLVYRVQVGAFARPLRSDVFKEFNPVSGEKIEGTNVTRYMAGYFSSSETVVQARQQIRDLGYSDAFVVAYCNGERLTMGEARRLEAAGICVPKRTEEIMIEVVENTAEKLNIPMKTEPEVVPEWTYAKAPGASVSEPIEKMEGLFFTVQIGVFNRPVSDAELQNLPKIFTFRLPNGQIRYNTGMFDSAEEALPRQQFARQSGIQGAFVVAYYQGKRISIGNARRLLLENGDSVLQSRQEIAPEPIEENTVRADSVRTDVIEMPPMEEWEKRVQIVSEKTFEEFPRDVLNRYNAEGSFYYDEVDKRVKSAVYDNEDYLPNLFNFRDDIDTVYLEEGLLADQQTEIIHFVFTDSLVPGAFMDWMLRCNYRREINRTYKGTEVRIFGVQEKDMDVIIERIRLFGVEPDKIKEEE